MKNINEIFNEEDSFQEHHADLRSPAANIQSEDAAKADRPKRVTINVDGKRKTVTQETADNARYGMGEWWEKEGKFL